MTKQEKAVLIAEKVLGFEYQGNIWTSQAPVGVNGVVRLDKKIVYPEEQITPENFIYSPEGFFAVLKALPQSAKVGDINFAWWRFFRDMDYEAFYNAVIEVFKDD